MKNRIFFLCIFNIYAAEHGKRDIHISAKDQLIEYVYTQDVHKFKILWQHTQNPNQKQDQLLLYEQEEKYVKDYVQNSINQCYTQEKSTINRKYACAGALTVVQMLTILQWGMSWAGYDQGSSKWPNIVMSCLSGYGLWHYYTQQQELSSSISKLEQIQNIITPQNHMS